MLDLAALQRFGLQVAEVGESEVVAPHPLRAAVCLRYDDRSDQALASGHCGVEAKTQVIVEVHDVVVVLLQKAIAENDLMMLS